MLLLRLAVGLACVFTACACAAANIALYYAADLPVDELRAFDIVVVEPDHGFDPKALASARTEFFAYVSVGEVSPARKFFDRLDPAWKIGVNPTWGGAIIDQTQAAWHHFFMEEVIAPLWARGYRGFFLDTLDSYFLLSNRDHPWAKQVEGTAELVRAVKGRFPEAKLIFNRGFDIIPKVRGLVHTVAAESLFRSYDAGRQAYIETPERDQAETLALLRKVRDEEKLPVLVIAYVPPRERALARQTAAKIRKLGFKPFVTSGALDMVGLGDIEVQPRKVLVVVDTGGELLDNHKAQRFIATPLNYMGYSLEFVEVRGGLPSTPLPGRYAGIVTWFDVHESAEGTGYARWLKRALADGMRIAVFEHFGIALDADLQATLGLTVLPRIDPTRLTVLERAPMIGYEMEPLVDSVVYPPIRIDEASGSRTLLRLANARNMVFDAIAYLPVGGYAMTPYAIRELTPLKYSRWIVEPFEFLRRTLALVPFPVPDVTTENGRRLMFVHIDGDGFPSAAEIRGTPLASEVLADVLEKYRVPTTMSVIQGEVAPDGLHKALSPRMEAVARRIFALPHVEAASHSHSHPFYWAEAVKGVKRDDGRPVGLSIPGYRFDLAREIDGSIEYITRRLLPAGKRVEMFLWTGDCIPPGAAIKQAYAAGVLNMNGGDTVITRSKNSLSLIAPIGIKKGGYIQVYAPNQNENVYTNDWTGPFYGFERVIETFDLTESPRRFKPINLYYHTYAVSKLASIAALHKIYAHVLAQPVHPIYASEYARKAIDFMTLVIARDHGRDAWIVRGTGDLRTLRLDPGNAVPSLAASSGIVGYAPGPAATYLHLSGAETVLRGTAPDAIPYLHMANGRVLEWSRERSTLKASFRSHVPLVLEFANAERCELSREGRLITPVAGGERKRYEIADTGRHDLVLTCR